MLYNNQGIFWFKFQCIISNLQRNMISTKQVHQSSDWLWIFTHFGRWEKVVSSGITSLWLIWLKLLSPSLWCWLFSLQTEGQNSNHNKNHLGSRYVSFLDFVYKNVTFSQFRCKPASPLKSEHHHTFRSFSLIGWANNKHSDITSVLMELHILMHWNHILSMNAAKTGGMSLCNCNRVEKYGGACQNGLHSSIFPKCRKQNQKRLKPPPWCRFNFGKKTWVFPWLKMLQKGDFARVMFW